MSYNILQSGDGRLEPICDVVGKARPDVLVCQEARRLASIREIGRRLEMNWLIEACAEPPDVAIFSPHHLEPIDVERPACRRPPGLAVARVHLPGGELLVAGLHLSSQLALPWGGVDVRVEQAVATIEALGPLRAVPHLLVGDFNAFREPYGLVERRPPDSGHWFTPFLATESLPMPQLGWLYEAMQHLIARPTIWRVVRPLIARINPSVVLERFVEAGYVDCFDRRRAAPNKATAGDIAHSWPSFSPAARIDHVFATHDLVDRVTACWIVDDEVARTASDHLPIMAQVEWCEQRW